jgi:hypothetical protein
VLLVLVSVLVELLLIFSDLRLLSEAVNGPTFCEFPLIIRCYFSTTLEVSFLEETEDLRLLEQIFYFSLFKVDLFVWWLAEEKVFVNMLVNELELALSVLISLVDLIERIESSDFFDFTDSPSSLIEDSFLISLKVFGGA